MSTGGIIGGVVGAVIGFFIGGPVGAVWGAAIGMGIGMGIEMMAADRPSPGEPELGDLAVNMAKEGALLPDILGTPKLNANVLWTCCNRVTEITEEQGGKGGGGGEEVVTGYKYYLTWAVGICFGPVDKLFTIYKNDEVVWHGELNCPVSGGVETITLDGMGAADFYFGTDDHALSSYIGSRLDDSTLNPPYRNQCWMLLKDCYIGDYNRAPSMHFVLGKYPDIAALTSADRKIEVYDYNAAHALYYLLNTLADLPTTWLDPDSFNEAAKTLRAEGLGLTILFNNQASSQAYAEMILQHIGGLLRYSGDSKLHLKLWRGTDQQSAFPIINESSFLEAPTIERKSWIDTLNEVRVQHSNRFFRDLVCPSGCDGFSGDLSEIGGGDLRTFTIENPDWDELAGNCSDLSFLSDGLSAGRAGTFDNLQKISKGVWSFDYTSNVALCTGQDPYDPLYCPTICGNHIPCCLCAGAGNVEWDDDESAEEVAPSDTVDVFVKEGVGPYTWEIAGSGFSLGSEQTAGLANTVITSGAGCGAGEITVTDACGTECEGVVRCTVGQWIQKSTGVCQITGPASWIEDDGNSAVFDFTIGKGRQQETILYKVGQSPDTYCDSPFMVCGDYCPDGYHCLGSPFMHSTLGDITPHCYESQTEPGLIHCYCGHVNLVYYEWEC